MKYITLRRFDGGLCLVAKEADKLADAYGEVSGALSHAMTEKNMRAVYRHADNLSRIAGAILDIENQQAFNNAMLA